MDSLFSDHRAASTIVRGGPADLIGEEIIAVELVAVDGKEFVVPQLLPGASEYVATFHAEIAADRLREEVLANLDESGSIPCADVTPALDFRETAGTAVASAATGLEAFANFHIRRALTAESGDQRESVREEIASLRNRPLNERYADHLPKLLGQPRPTNERWWPILRRIQGMAALQRHGVTEPKQRAGLEGCRSLNQRLYNREYQGASDMMLAAFEYFAPGWISSDRLEHLNASAQLATSDR